MLGCIRDVDILFLLPNRFRSFSGNWNLFLHLLGDWNSSYSKTYSSGRDIQVLHCEFSFLAVGIRIKRIHGCFRVQNAATVLCACFEKIAQRVAILGLFISVLDSVLGPRNCISELSRQVRQHYPRA